MINRMSGDRAPPPPPPPPLLSAYQRFPPIPTSTLNSSPYGFYNPYSQPGLYPTPFDGYTQQQPEFGSFIRVAEESSRGVFQSLESMIAAISSIANLLNSTHNAVFNSFRAVIGIVEQFRHLRHYLTAVVFVSVLQWVRAVWRRVLISFRLKPKNYNSSNTDNNIWAAAIQGNTATTMSGGGFNWSGTFMFLMAVGIPYLLYKAVAQMMHSAEESRQWAKGVGKHYTAKALYDFTASSSHELTFRAEELLRVAPKMEQPKVRDWLLASSIDGERIGLVPANYIKLLSG